MGDARIISDAEATRHILTVRDRYALYLGAGASVDAGVKSAQGICEDLRKEMIASANLGDEGDPGYAERAEEWANEYLNWNDPSRRYLSCMLRGRPNGAQRVEYFRAMLRGKQPSFCHHAAALLMSEGHFRNTCLTTNFDHLIESAFLYEGIVDCQPIRSDAECVYHQPADERFYVIKLHGDVDTLNILNTRQETIAISEPLAAVVGRVAQNAGFVVMGTAGNEKSVRGLVETLALNAKKDASTVLSFGLLWGVYMGEPRPTQITDDEMAGKVRDRIDATDIHTDIQEAIGDSDNPLFCFFPVWSAGEFMLQVVTATRDKALISRATQRLDHEMRLQHVFAGAGLSRPAVAQHLDTLRRQRERLGGTTTQSREVDHVLTATDEKTGCELRVVYADITSRTVLSDPDFGDVRRAVVSPDDTFISAGGGVAYQLLRKAGPQTILNELSKFAPIEHCAVAVTSGGALPVHYIFHAAALEIDENAHYSVSKPDVTATMQAILQKAHGLDIGAIWVPLLGAGTASLDPSKSFDGLLQGLARERERWSKNGDGAPLAVAIAIYQERELPRGKLAPIVKRVLGPDFAISV
jgi:O-acetyl-ADP-ribose deacetylase (regulator of RNase III)/NAD-dependent SIR2 family protein deacetylase